MFSLSWSNHRDRPRGGNLKNPSWEDIEARLEQARNHCGSVTLDILDSPKNLQVICDGDKYLVTLGELYENEYRVRSFFNASAKPDQIELSGYLWDSRTVCSEFSTVVRTFRMF